ncbi:hypothetical protein JCM5350_003803 [Sporobolomyces pararoseus]
MPSTRQASAPRRSGRSKELEKKKQQQAKKAQSTASKAARAVKPKADKAKKVVKKAADKVEKKATAASSSSSSTTKPAKKSSSKPASAPPAKPAPTPRGPPKERGALPTAEEKKEIKAAKKESAATAKSSAKSSTGGAAASGSGYKEGEVVEDITLKNDSDEEVALSSLYNESGLVIFTYPKANTPGCTTQSCNYRDIKSEFETLGYKVLGLSRDSPKSQSSWKTKHDFKYDLLCDPEAQLLKKLGATESQKRCHFIIEKGGKLLEAKVGVKPADDAQNALNFIKSLEKKD